MNNDQLSITDESFVSPTPPLRERFVSSSPGNLFQTSVQFFSSFGGVFHELLRVFRRWPGGGSSGKGGMGLGEIGKPIP